jgi:hypothetical protein
VNAVNLPVLAIGGEGGVARPRGSTSLHRCKRFQLTHHVPRELRDHRLGERPQQKAREHVSWSEDSFDRHPCAPIVLGFRAPPARSRQKWARGAFEQVRQCNARLELGQHLACARPPHQWLGEHTSPRCTNTNILGVAFAVGERACPAMFVPEVTKECPHRSIRRADVLGNSEANCSRRHDPTIADPAAFGEQSPNAHRVRPSRRARAWTALERAHGVPAPVSAYVAICGKLEPPEGALCFTEGR